MKTTTDMSSRQAPLYELYAEKPESAQIEDYAITTCDITAPDNPLRGDVEITHSRNASLKVGVHRAVGGDSDHPTPGDILCAALASCLDSTLRVVANRIGMEITYLSAEVVGEVDVRGTLRASDACPVGFQRFRSHVDIRVAEGTDEKLVEQVIKAAEYSCVVLQTLRGAPDTPLTASINEGDALNLTEPGPANQRAA